MSALSSLSWPPRSMSVCLSHARAMTSAQKSTQCTYCQLYTCLNASYFPRSVRFNQAQSGLRTLVFVFMLFRKWMASCLMYPNACWYDAEWSVQNSSLAEFFIRLIAGSVCALVDLHERTRVRYVFLRTISRTDSSVAPASRRTERKAAIRTLSSALDQ